MAAHSLTLDHLVVAARTLEEGVAYVADTLGIEPAGGGAHPSMRTHNRLFGLDDPATHARLEQGPYLAHWVARVDRPRELGLWQRQYPARIARVVPMTRGDFGWRLTVPDDGALPAWQGAGDGVLPSLIQWSDARHPCDALPHGDVALTALKAAHPRADTVREQLVWLNAAHLLELDAGETPALAAEFDTPRGARTLR